MVQWLDYVSLCQKETNPLLTECNTENLREAIQKKIKMWTFSKLVPPLEIWTEIFEDIFFKQILTGLLTLHTSFSNFDILTMYLVASDFVKTESILKFYLIFNLSKIQFRQCELWGQPPPPFWKKFTFWFFLEGFP